MSEDTTFGRGNSPLLLLGLQIRVSAFQIRIFPLTLAGENVAGEEADKEGAESGGDAGQGEGLLGVQVVVLLGALQRLDDGRKVDLIDFISDIDLDSGV